MLSSAAQITRQLRPAEATQGIQCAAPRLPAERMLARDEALTRLLQMDPRQGRLVERMHIGGLTDEESAEAIGISVRTARDWKSARAWLQSEFRRCAV